MTHSVYDTPPAFETAQPVRVRRSVVEKYQEAWYLREDGNEHIVVFANGSKAAIKDENIRAVDPISLDDARLMVFEDGKGGLRFMGGNGIHADCLDIFKREPAFGHRLVAILDLKGLGLNVTPGQGLARIV